MKLLLVEDDAEVIERLGETFERADIAVVVAQSVEEALVQIELGDFDMLVCDLVIPPTTNGPAISTSAGLQVSDHAQEKLPGTPILIYSGFRDMDDLESRLAFAPPADLVGTGFSPLLRALDKGKPDKLKAAVLDYAEDLKQLEEAVVVTWDGDPEALNPMDSRVLQIYGRQRGGEVVLIRRLAGGRSGAVTLWTEVEEQGGGLTGRVVAKLNTLDEIADEKARIETHAAHVLSAPTFAGSVSSISAGARDRGGLFYSVAQGYDETLFDVLARDPNEAAGVVDQIASDLEPWHGKPTPKTWTVGQIRRLLVADSKLSQLRADPTWKTTALEARNVPGKKCHSHGDLHAGNILVNKAHQAMLIDFARAGFAPPSLDPITLELSAILHPDSKVKLSGWPSMEQAENWANDAEYLKDSPIEAFVAACRRWTRQVQRTDRETAATLYAFALRQLRYDDVDLELASAFSRGAATRALAV